VVGNKQDSWVFRRYSKENTHPWEGCGRVQGPGEAGKIGLSLACNVQLLNSKKRVELTYIIKKYFTKQIEEDF
jgi:hypothetical protein